MKTLCLCGVYLVDTESANYVRNGVPLCNPATCQKVKEHDRAGYYRQALEDRSPNELED